MQQQLFCTMSLVQKPVSRMAATGISKRPAERTRLCQIADTVRPLMESWPEDWSDSDLRENGGSHIIIKHSHSMEDCNRVAR